MAENRPIRLDHILGRERAAQQLAIVHSTILSLATVQLPLDEERGNALIANGVISPEGFTKLKNPEPPFESSEAVDLSRIMLHRSNLITFLKELGATLLSQGNPEGIPITLATLSFYEDDIQDLIHQHTFFYKEGFELVDKAHSFAERGGVIVFPSYNDLQPSAAAVAQPADRIVFKPYRGTRLPNRITSQVSDIDIATQMIRVAPHS